MGVTPSSQQIQKLKGERISLEQLQLFVSQIKTEEDIEEAIKQYLSIMTLKEKIGQLQQISYGDETLSPQIIKTIQNGAVGSFLNVWKLENVNQMQKITMEQSRLKIPLLIGKDVIHGYRTVFPIPLAQAASFRPTLVQEGSRVAAIECSAMGIKWTFTPMVDIARDPRWGRIAEGFGEDPFLAATMGAAVVKGFQSNDKSDLTAVAACGKHYVGYGATEGGRDYNTTLIPQNILRDVYLVPFKGVCDAGCLTYMSAFNDLNGSPCCANKMVLKDILRSEWKFDGVMVSDYNAVDELINHGYAENTKDAARRSFNNGLDMEMVSTCLYDNLQTLINEKLCTLADLNQKVANILRVKFKMNLFKNYYTDPSRQAFILTEANKAKAKQMALQCPILLQNKNKTLPIDKSIKSLAVIGALANDPENQIGCWAPDGKAQDSITPLTSLKASLTNTNLIYAPGYKSVDSKDTSLLDQALKAASSAQKVVVFVGESNNMSGQSCCRAYINLPGMQQTLIQELSKLGKPIILVIYAGRSITLQNIIPLVDSVLYAWQLGTMAGPALADLLTGVVSPSGKCPITFPRTVGQIPLYYNKKNGGRPNDTHQYIPFTSSYIDSDSTPLFTFGYGLSYTSFSYSNLKLSKNTFTYGQTILITANLKNQGSVVADQTTFLFVRDLVGSLTRPVRQLKDFSKTKLSPGQTTTVAFVIKPQMLTFWTENKEYKAEPGKFYLWVGGSLETTLGAEFTLQASTEEEFEHLS